MKILLIAPASGKWQSVAKTKLFNGKTFRFSLLSLLSVAADAGCIGLFVGLETFSERNLSDVNKSCHRVDQYRNAIELLHSYGIGVEAGIVFGFDGDGPDVFSKTLDMLDELEVDMIQTSVFTPLPGTKRFAEIRDRIFDLNGSNYDFHNVVFQPKGMSPQELQAGLDWVTNQFYQPERIAKRLWRHFKRPKGVSTLPYVAAINMAYYGRITNWKIKGWDPGKHEIKSFGDALDRVCGNYDFRVVQ